MHIRNHVNHSADHTIVTSLTSGGSVSLGHTVFWLSNFTPSSFELLEISGQANGNGRTPDMSWGCAEASADSRSYWRLWTAFLDVPSPETSRPSPLTVADWQVQVR